MKNLLAVKFKIDPGTSVRDDPGVKEKFAASLSLIRIEKHARGPMELADNNPLRSIDDKGTIGRHEGNFPKVYLLFLHRFDITPSCLIVNIIEDQSEGHFDGRSVGGSFEDAFVNIILRLS